MHRDQSVHKKEIMHAALGISCTTSLEIVLTAAEGQKLECFK